MSWSKSRVSYWLLISLIPTGVGGFLLFMFGWITGIFSIAAGAAMWIIAFFLILYWWGALIAGLVLRFNVKKEAQLIFREAQAYAEMNSWLPLSHTAWRAMRANNVSLAVNQPFDKSTYTLSISSDTGATTVPEFVKPLWALQFGDWLWEKTGGHNLTPTEVQRQQQEWSRSLAIRPNHPPRRPF